jgi:hypothetical protein
MNNVMSNNLGSQFNYNNMNNSPTLNESFLSRRGNDIMGVNPIRQDLFMPQMPLQGQMYNHNTGFNYQNTFPQQEINNPPNQMNFNQNMDHIVRNTLISRGMLNTDHKQSNSFSPVHYNQKFENGAVDDKERKKMLLNNIQQQIVLTKNSKQMELERKRKEDEKYLNDMLNFYPFGRGGAGAPIRDKQGNVVTSRKGLISDPKYHHFSINVDDDYEDVMKNSGKQYGMVNFANKNNQVMNQMNYQPLQNMSRLQSGVRGVSSSNLMNGGEYNSRGQVNFQGVNPNPQVNYQSQFDNNMNTINTMNNQPFINEYNPNQNNQPMMPFNYENNLYSNNPVPSNIPPVQFNPNNIPQMNQQNQPMQNFMPPAENPQFYNYNEPIPNGQINPPASVSNPNNFPLSISYKNSEVDGDQKKKDKQDYGSYLRTQMEIDKRKKDMEREQKKKEEMEEEMRIRREMEELRIREEREKDKKKSELDKLKNDNDVLRDQYVVSKKKKINFEDEFGKNQNNNFNENINQQNSNQIYPSENNYNNQNFQQQNFQNGNQQYTMPQVPPQAPQGPSQEDIELRHNINNEILNLRNGIVEQQTLLLKQINDLKTETQSANLQRYEVLKEFSTLKEEISKQRVDEEMRRKYVYDVLVDNNSKVSNLYGNTKLPDLNPDDFKMEFPLPRNHKKNYKNMYYDETIKNPNRVKEIPRLDSINKGEMKASSKFIDVDSHNVVESLNIYQPTKRDVELEKIKSKGFELDEDFGPLRSFYKENKNIQKNNYEKISEKLDLDLGIGSQGSGLERNNFNYLNSRKTPNVKKLSTPLSNYGNFEENIYSGKKTHQTPAKFDNHTGNQYQSQENSDDIDNLSIDHIYNKNMERLRYLNNLEDNYNKNI